MSDDGPNPAVRGPLRLSCAVGRGILASLLLVCSCASPPDSESVSREIQDRTRHDTERPSGTDFALPARVSLEDGLDEDEAIAVALWNSAPFRELLTSLAVATADLQQAGLLPNPVLLIQFPVSSKQFEGLLAWALDVLWTRGPRRAAAQSEWEATAERLVETALDLVLQVRLAFTNALAASRTAELAEERAILIERLAAISSYRAQRGQVGHLEAALHRLTAIEQREWAIAAKRSMDDALLRLRAQIGTDPSLDAYRMGEARTPPTVPALAALREEALGTRPEVRAAELRLEAAAQRLGWERRKIIRFSALLDANGQGENGFEIGPGLEIELPLFDRNQAGIARAEAGIEAAAWGYTGARLRVSETVERNYAEYAHARDALLRWQRDALPAARRSSALAQQADRTGSISYARVIDAQDRLVAARLRAVELEAAFGRAVAELERSAGRALDAE